MHKVGVLFLSCAHWPHRRAPWWRKWSTTERLRPHCCSRQPPSSRRLSVCVGSDCGSNCTESGCDRSSPSRSLSAQFSLSNSSLAVTSSEVSRFCEPSRSFAREERFLRRVGRFFPKAARLGSKSPAFLPKVRRSFPPLRPFSAQRVAVCKKIPRCLPDSGGISFAACIAGRVARSGFSTWRRWGAIA